MDILAYATTYDADGEPVIVDAPLTDPPQRMESNAENLIVSSVELEDGLWQHEYVDRSSGVHSWMLVRPA